MRGKLGEHDVSELPVRITPAHAGKTSFLLSGASSLSDHPRACGENYISASFGMVKVGSPPRMRGKQ